jgi:hypothetical protein
MQGGPVPGPCRAEGRPRRLGHLLFWEEPDRFVNAVTLFLLAETCAPEGAARRRREALSFDAVAISMNGRMSRNFRVEESVRREAEVSEALIIVVDGYGVGPEEVR